MANCDSRSVFSSVRSCFGSPDAGLIGKIDCRRDDTESVGASLDQFCFWI